jgi:NTP pyrophosphatase (non-canonical NTP hydrolase)
MEQLEKLFEEVKKKRTSQDNKWGQQNHSPELWMLILGEEVGECNKAALEAYFSQKYDAYKNPQTLEDLRQELIQVAAVSLAIVESLDRNQLNPNKNDNTIS